MKRKNEKGITLVALVITIILMLILAGVVISLTLGENGIFNTAKYAVVKTEEETAREKLELALADLQARKYTDETYDENEYINNYLRKERMTVEGNVVLVDGWKFTIDRSVPKIGGNVEQEELKKVTITTPYVGTTSFTTKISYVYNESEIESYIYKIDDEEITKNDKEYTTPEEQELQPESTHTVKVIAKYKDETTIESNVLTIKTEPRTYLYNNGDECIDITGGWRSIAIDNGLSESNIKHPDVTNIEDDSLSVFLYSDENLQSGSVAITKKIDYSQYKYLNISYIAFLSSYSSSTTIQLYKNYETISYYDNYIETLCYNSPINTKRNLRLDISAINDFNSFYIYLQASKDNAADLGIYEVWLDK